MSSRRFQHAMSIGRQARTAAAKVVHSMFPGWRQHRFRGHLGRFIGALEHLPQDVAARLTPGDISELSALIDGVVAEAEGFMAARHDSTTSEIEQDRYVVTDIYRLRSIVESLNRHVTANPDLEDVGWKERTQGGHQPKP